MNYETEIDIHLQREQYGWLLRVKKGRGVTDCELGISRWKLLYMGWKNNKVLL